MFSNQRYLTKGVQADIPFELQIFMWGCIDRLPEERDYFQIFKPDNLDGIQRIAYVNDGRVTIFKRPKPAHKVYFNAPNGTKAIMGHTRMTTQGNEKHNFNNHPFPGHADRDFAFAHNGVLYNDKALRKEKKLPDTHIETDSYIAVQLIEQHGILDFDSLKSMAETVNGSFCFTVLDEYNSLYIVKGSNPMCLLHFKELGLYVYASTESIMKSI